MAQHPRGWVSKKVNQYRIGERIVATRPIEMVGGIIKVGMTGRVLKTASELGEEGVVCTFDGCESFCEHVNLKPHKIESLEYGNGAQYIGQPSVPARCDDKGWFDPAAGQLRVVLRSGEAISGRWTGSTLAADSAYISAIEIDGRKILAADIAEMEAYYKNRV